MILRPFDPQRFSELRAPSGISFGQPLTYHAETASTNDLALAAGRAGAPSGSLFVADHQSSGRGRRGKTWSAAPGHGLLFSVLVRPENASPISAVTLAVGLGVRAALQPHSREALAIKWPNDVLAGSRKLGGILCEGQLEGSRLQALVIGVGINLAESGLPPDLAESAVSLATLAPDASALEPPAREPFMEREQLLVEVLGAIEARVSACLSGGSAGTRDLLSEFSRYDALAGKRVVVSGGVPLVGVARGVDAEGRLLVESDGMRVAVHSGTIRLA